MKTIASWLLAFRLKTLTAAIVPIFAATTLAFLQNYVISWILVGCLLGSALSIQVATNLFNDAIDFVKGADKDRIGPVRVTQSGAISAALVMTGAFLFCALAVMFGIPLVLRGGLPIVIIGLVSLFMAYGYTGGPYPLAYKGLGDLFVILFFGLLAVAGSHYILTLVFSYEALLLGLQIGFLATVLIAVNNLRDSQTDALVGKRTLAVRFGDRFVVHEIQVLFVLTYILSLYWIYRYGLRFILLFVGTLLCVKVLRIITRFEDRAHLNKALGMSAGVHLLFGITFFLGSLL